MDPETFNLKRNILIELEVSCEGASDLAHLEGEDAVLKQTLDSVSEALAKHFYPQQ